MLGLVLFFACLTASGLEMVWATVLTKAALRSEISTRQSQMGKALGAVVFSALTAMAVAKLFSGYVLKVVASASAP